MQADVAVNRGSLVGPAYSWQRLRNKAVPVVSLAASRGATVIAQFTVQLAVSSMAGAAGLGLLQLFTSWICIAGEILALGLPARTMRQVSVAYAEQGVQVVQHILRDARRQIVKFWLTLMVIAVLPAALLMPAIGTPTWATYGWLLLAAAVFAPLFSIGRLYAESLKAAEAPLAAVTLESLTSPLALLLLCLVCWFAGLTLATHALLATFALSVAITPLALYGKLRRQLARLKPPAEEIASDMLRPAAPRAELFSLWGGSVLSIGFIQLPFVVLPFYADTAEIGVFAVANKLVNVITTLLLLQAAVFGPAFARCAGQQNAAELLRLLRRTQLISIAIFLPLSLSLIVLAQPLSALFGEDFGDLHLYLVILTAGQIINAATGLPGVMLNMSGAADKELYSLVLALLCALLGSVMLGPEHGAIGLAMVFSGSIALKNIVSYALARQYLSTLRWA